MLLDAPPRPLVAGRPKRLRATEVRPKLEDWELGGLEPLTELDAALELHGRGRHLCLHALHVLAASSRSEMKVAVFCVEARAHGLYSLSSVSECDYPVQRNSIKQESRQTASFGGVQWIRC